MSDLGVSRDREDRAGGAYAEDVVVTSIPLKDKVQVRIVEGVERVHRVWLPYNRLNQNDEMELSWHCLSVGEESILRDFALCDQRIQMEETKGAAKDCKSRSIPQTSWLYTCFRRGEEVPTLRKLVANYTVFNALKRLQQEVVEGREDYLKHGLLFMFDLFIRKGLKDERKREIWSNIAYFVEPIFALDNPFAGKVPVKAREDGNKHKQKILDNLVAWKIFTKEELEVIRTSEVDLKQAAEPMSDEEIIQKLSESPIDLQARDQSKTKALIYPFPDLLAKECEKLGIPFTMGGLSAPEEESVEAEPQEKEKVVGEKLDDDSFSLDIEKEKASGGVAVGEKEEDQLNFDDLVKDATK